MRRTLKPPGFAGWWPCKSLQVVPAADPLARLRVFAEHIIVVNVVLAFQVSCRRGCPVPLQRCPIDLIFHNRAPPLRPGLAWDRIRHAAFAGSCSATVNSIWWRAFRSCGNRPAYRNVWIGTRTPAVCARRTTAPTSVSSSEGRPLRTSRVLPIAASDRGRAPPVHVAQHLRAAFGRRRRRERLPRSWLLPATPAFPKLCAPRLREETCLCAS
jgi:hypothetical protein